ncbi:unnamed protein product [Orchesella dallaii]|uniref:Uncharacterized protein n=1 Tax=Orchesella dallaii TaxID=48710 RepID=A0ABP1QIU4_9HEXA
MLKCLNGDQRLSLSETVAMSNWKTEGDSQNQAKSPDENLTEKVHLEFHSLNSEIVKIQRDYCNYKIQTEDKFSTLQAKNNQLRSEVERSATAVHKIYQEMSEVLVQNRIIAENNHKLIAEKEDLENKINELEQSESRSQALVSVKCLEFSEEEEILLGELNCLKSSKENLYLELKTKIKKLEEDVQEEKKRNESLQLEFMTLIKEKYKLELTLRKREAMAGRLRGKYQTRVNTSDSDKASDKNKKKRQISKVKSPEAATKNMQIPSNVSLNISNLERNVWKFYGNENAVNSGFMAMKPFCASPQTPTIPGAGSISGGMDETEIVTLSDSEV